MTAPTDLAVWLDRQIRATFSVPPNRIAEHAPIDLPCYCRPVTRAARTHAPGCPWWELAFGPDAASRPDIVVAAAHTEEA